MDRSESSSKVSASRVTEEVASSSAALVNTPAKPSPTKFQRDDYCSRPDLLSRGWTDSMIRDFLSKPDCTKPNPRYKCAADMKFYRDQRVQAVEQSDEWKRRRELAERRSDAAWAAAERRREDTERLIGELPTPEIEMKPLTTVRREAYHSWRRRRSFRGKETNPMTCIDEATLGRITVNYIRHELSEYDRLLHSVKGVVGAEEARCTIREKVMDQIRTQYPELASEVVDQSISKIMRRPDHFPWC